MSAGTLAPAPPAAATPSEPARTSVARNATLLAAANVAARALVLGLAVALGRGLGVGEYGRYGFAVAVATVIVPVADLGLTDYVWREVARGGAGVRGQARRMIEIKLALSAATLALGAAVALATSDPGAAAVVIIVLAFTVADGVSTFVFAYFQGREQMRFEAGWTVLAALLKSIGGIALVIAFGRLMPVIGWMLAVSTAQLAMAALRFRRATAVSGRDPEPGRPIVWRSVLSMGVLSVSVLIYIRADSIILGIIDGHRAVGLYTAAYALMGAAQIIPLQISQAVTPVLSRTFAVDRAAFRRHCDQGLAAVLVVALPLALVTSILSTGIVTIPYGSRFAGASTALAVLVWASPLGVANAMVAAVLYAAGREGRAAVVAIVAVVVNLGLNAVLIPRFGIGGAAVVTVVTEIAVLVLQLVYAARSGVGWAPKLPYGRIALSLLVLGVVATVARSLGTPAAALLGVGAYAVTALGTGAVDRAGLRSLRGGGGRPAA